MRIAVLSDIHGNWPALAAVLEDMNEVDDVICLGDVVGYGAQPARCADEVMTRGWLTLVGNHDRACTDPDILDWFNPDAAKVIRWTREELSDDQLGWLAGLPDQADRFGILLVHASPRDHIFEYVLDGLAARDNLRILEDRVCFHGHSHVPGLFFMAGDGIHHDYRGISYQLHGPVLVNPGSVGQPRDGDPGASYGVWDLDEGTFTYRRVPYDVKSAQAAIRAARLPERFASRLAEGR